VKLPLAQAFLHQIMIKEIYQSKYEKFIRLLDVSPYYLSEKNIKFYKYSKLKMLFSCLILTKNITKLYHFEQEIL